MKKHLARHQRRFPQQDFAGQQGRHKTLPEMADAIIGITFKIENVLKVKPDRDFGIRIVTTHDQDRPMDKNHLKQNSAQRKIRLGEYQQRRSDHDRQHFEEPRQSIGRIKGGYHKGQHPDTYNQPDFFRCRHAYIFLVQTYASIAVMLGLASPL